MVRVLDPQVDTDVKGVSHQKLSTTQDTRRQRPSHSLFQQIKIKKLSTGIRNFTPLANNHRNRSHTRKEIHQSERENTNNRKNQDETINTKIWKSLLNKDNENNAYV